MQYCCNTIAYCAILYIVIIIALHWEIAIFITRMWGITISNCCSSIYCNTRQYYCPNPWLRVWRNVVIGGEWVVVTYVTLVNTQTVPVITELENSDFAAFIGRLSRNVKIEGVDDEVENKRGDTCKYSIHQVLYRRLRELNLIAWTDKVKQIDLQCSSSTRANWRAVFFPIIVFENPFSVVSLWKVHQTSKHHDITQHRL